MNELIAEIVAKGWGFTVCNIFQPSSGDSAAIEGERMTAEVHVPEETGNYTETIYYETRETDPEKALRFAFEQAIKANP